MSRCGITGTTHKSQAGDGSALLGRSVGQLNESLVGWSDDQLVDSMGSWSVESTTKMR